MRNLLAVAIFFLLNSAYAQNLDGVTGIADTSYTNASAFAKDVKKYPNIKLVKALQIEGVVETKNIIYGSTGTRDLKLDVFQNSNLKDSLSVAIIIIHGGGWRTGNREQHHPMAQKLASLGYVCFTPEYRLSTEALFPAAIYDLKSAIKWVRANAMEYQIDTEKIVVAGFSAGGELASFLGSTPNMPLFEGEIDQHKISSHVNAVINMDGILSFVHPESGEGNDIKKTSAATYWFGYSKNEKPLLWEAASALSYVGPKTPPTLFVNSSLDRMHAGRADYIKVLNKHDIYSEVLSFQTAPHSFVLYHPWFEPIVAKIDDFLMNLFR